MNRGNLRAEIRRLIKDTSADSNLQRFSDTVLNDRINNVQNEIVAGLFMLESRIATSLVANQQEYELPSYFLAPISETSVQILPSGSSNYKSIRKITESELDLYDPDWRSTDTNEPIYFYLRRDKIGLYPYPNYALTNGMRIDFYRLCDDMDGDTDIPFQGEYRYYPHHMIVAYGVAKLCKMDEGEWNNVQAFAEEMNKIASRILKVVNLKTKDSRLINAYEFTRKGPRRVR